MKIRIVDRIMAALAGLALLALCAGIIAQVFFGVNLKGRATAFLAVHPIRGRVILIAGAVILAVVGVYCVSILFRRRRKSERFVRQKTETGTLDISLDAMETLVRKCLEQHPELETQQLTLEGRRDGLLIRIAGNVAGGLSIPLTVDLIQRQIKQYVTACSGIAVRDILVQIEASGEAVGDVPFAVEAPAGTLLLKEGEERKTEAKPGILPETAAAASAEEDRPRVYGENTERSGVFDGNGEKADAAEEEGEKPRIFSDGARLSPVNTLRDAGAVPEEDADGEEDERAVHQRLFSTQDEPCVVPVPPEMKEGNQESPPEAADGKGGEPAPAETPETDGEPAPAETSEADGPEERDPEGSEPPRTEQQG